MVGELIDTTNMSNCSVGVHNQFFECVHLQCNCSLFKNIFLQMCRPIVHLLHFRAQPWANLLFPWPSKETPRQLDGRQNAANALNNLMTRCLKSHWFLIIVGARCAHLPSVCKVEFSKCADLLCICQVLCAPVPSWRAWPNQRHKIVKMSRFQDFRISRFQDPESL